MSTTTSLPSAGWSGDPSTKDDFLTFVQMSVVPHGNFAYRVYDGEEANMRGMSAQYSVLGGQALDASAASYR